MTQPTITHFPGCGECGAPCVLRRSTVMNLKTGKMREEWVWQRDCTVKHRKAGFVVYKTLKNGKVREVKTAVSSNTASRSNEETDA